MVARHPADEISGDRERGENGSERGEGREEEASGTLGVLTDWEEPLHQGVLTARKLLPIRYETVKQTQAGCSRRCGQDVPNPFFAAARFSLRFSLSVF
jgi:hypothetical protein